MKAGKRTLAVRFGRRAGILEYATLLAASYAAPVVCVASLGRSPWALLPLASCPSPSACSAPSPPAKAAR